MKRLSAAAFAAALFTLTSCASRSVGISPSSSPLRPGTRGSIPASGSSCQYSILAILPVGLTHSTQRALQEAKDEADVTALTDITIDETYHYFILFSKTCVYVEGLGVR